MHLDIPALVAAYGYPATFLGALFEGETILTLAGLAVHRGHLDGLAAWLLGAAGGALGDTIYFAIGHRFGTGALARFPSLAPAIVRVQGLVLRHPALAVIAVRFLYGVRIAGPVVIGASPLPWYRFVPLNLCGALLWSACWLGIGYGVGTAAHQLIGNEGKIERELFLGVLLIGVVAVATLRLRAGRSRKSTF